MRKVDEIVLVLVRAAIGSRPEGCGMAECDSECDLAGVTAPEWREVIDVAFEQGVAGIAADGYQKLADFEQSWVAHGCSKMMGTLLDGDELEDLRYEWFGSVLQAEEEYLAHRRAIGELAALFAERGIEMMVLKGYGLSLNWPVPEHRPVGDIDVYLFGKWREADEVVRKLGVEVDYGHHHHSVFGWKGFAVENHYDIVNRYASRSGRVLDDLLKELASRGRREVEVDGARVLLPGATFDGLFLLSHMAAHFAGDRIVLRHLVDWAMFVDRFSGEVDWNFVVGWARKLGLLRFLGCVNGLCVEQLGLEAGKFPRLERDAVLEQRVLEDILRPTFCERGSGFVFKLRRLRANRWKRDLVTAEPFVPRMVRLAWSHLMGPKLALYASDSRRC